MRTKKCERPALLPSSSQARRHEVELLDRNDLEVGEPDPLQLRDELDALPTSTIDSRSGLHVGSRRTRWMSSGVTAWTRSRKRADLLDRQLVEHDVQHLRGDVVRASRSSAESCRPDRPARRDSSRSETRSRWSLREFVDHQSKRLAGRFGAGVGLGHEVARLLARLRVSADAP